LQLSLSCRLVPKYLLLTIDSRGALTGKLALKRLSQLRAQRTR
jgi:hypothetical protein